MDRVLSYRQGNSGTNPDHCSYLMSKDLVVRKSAKLGAFSSDVSACPKGEGLVVIGFPADSLCEKKAKERKKRKWPKGKGAKKKRENAIKANQTFQQRRKQLRPRKKSEKSENVL